MLAKDVQFVSETRGSSKAEIEAHKDEIFAMGGYPRSRRIIVKDHETM